MKKNITKILSLLLVLMMLSTCFAFADAAVTAPAGNAVVLPTDVTDATLAEAVTNLMKADAITGDTDGLFHPQQQLTRAQVCKMLITLVDPDVANYVETPTQAPYSSTFTDLDGASWAKPYINYAAANNIAKGYNAYTFGPSNNVTVAELITFVVRACGYTDDILGGEWPNQNIKKAGELKLLENINADLTPAAAKATLATKAQAAIIISNAMDLIAKANAETMDWSLSGFVASLSAKDLTFVKSGSFDENLTKYNGVSLAKDVKVLKHSKKAKYAADMTLSKKTSDYELVELFTMKNVTCPAFYALENGKISTIIVPSDTGFSGRIYCVINDAATFNTSDGTAVEFNTLAAGKEIDWASNTKMNSAIVSSIEACEGLTNGGTVFELYASKGLITQVAVSGSQSGFSAKKGKVFEELTSDWDKVDDADTSRGIVSIDGTWIALNKNAAVYIYDAEDQEYTVGRLGSVKKNAEIRAYDISDDDEVTCDIIVVKQK